MGCGSHQRKAAADATLWYPKRDETREELQRRKQRTTSRLKCATTPLRQTEGGTAARCLFFTKCLFVCRAAGLACSVVLAATTYYL